MINPIETHINLVVCSIFFFLLQLKKRINFEFVLDVLQRHCFIQLHEITWWSKFHAKQIHFRIKPKREKNKQKNLNKLISLNLGCESVYSISILNVAINTFIGYLFSILLCDMCLFVCLSSAYLTVCSICNVNSVQPTSSSSFHLLMLIQ